MLQEAIWTISNVSCVRFIRMKDEQWCCRHTSNMKVTAHEGGCYADTGRSIEGQPTIVNLDPAKCFRKLGYILHELLHALGRNHMMTHPDRDQYVSILWDNVEEGTNLTLQIQITHQTDNVIRWSRAKTSHFCSHYFCSPPYP
ncbi:hypothetical protein PR048_009246 [Dryococelus australis]|uniref:Metalloendopeptidase n=1 Tax=Dryococelus australis TaxID=614101 RepID=A0ABQ9HZB8_9NEOP|nr:hypothetical protein PR048_009246 [Dryococelus australis]